MKRCLCAVVFLTALVAQQPRTWVITEPVDGSPIPIQLTFVPTSDGIYTPVALRKPAGPGPFPAVLFFAGNGGGGMPAARRAMLGRGYTSDQFLDAGYVVAWLRYRAEVPAAYQGARRLQVNRRTLSRSPLDHDDLLSIIDYVQDLPFVDGSRVGLIGSSHGGELILKAAAETDFAAGVLSEPAAHEYLAVAMDQLPPGEPQFQDKQRVAELADKAVAMERIRQINTPMLVVGRDSDHLQGVFRLTYDWLKEAGKDVEWMSYDHPRHGFIFPGRAKDGSYLVDDTQRAAIERVMEFFRARLKP
jgi:dienelactone hydrolase